MTFRRNALVTASALIAFALVAPGCAAPQALGKAANGIVAGAGKAVSGVAKTTGKAVSGVGKAISKPFGGGGHKKKAGTRQVG